MLLSLSHVALVAISRRRQPGRDVPLILPRKPQHIDADSYERLSQRGRSFGLGPAVVANGGSGVPVIVKRSVTELSRTLSTGISARCSAACVGDAGGGLEGHFSRPELDGDIDVAVRCASRWTPGSGRLTSRVKSVNAGGAAVFESRPGTLSEMKRRALERRAIDGAVPVGHAFTRPNTPSSTIAGAPTQAASVPPARSPSTTRAAMSRSVRAGERLDANRWYRIPPR